MYKPRDANPTSFRWRLPFLKTFLFILTPKLDNLLLSGKFCVIEIVCAFEDLPHFCLNPPYFLDVKVGISASLEKYKEIIKLAMDQ